MWPGGKPTDIDGFTPSQVASVLGLDQIDLIRPVPHPDAIAEAERARQEKADGSGPPALNRAQRRAAARLRRSDAGGIAAVADPE